MNQQQWKKTRTYQVFKKHAIISSSFGLFFVLIGIYGFAQGDVKIRTIGLILSVVIYGFTFYECYRMHEIHVIRQTFACYKGKIMNVDANDNYRWPERLVIEFSDDQGVKKRMMTHAVLYVNQIQNYLEKEVNVYYSSKHDYVIFDDPEDLKKEDIRL